MVHSSTLSRALLGLVVAIGLVVTGCDSGGSDSKSWEGNWELTQFDEDPTDGVVDQIDNDDSDDDDDFAYYSLSSDEFTFVTVDDSDGPSDPQDCFISQASVAEIDGNKVTIEFRGQLETLELTVSDGTLNGEVVRANQPSREDDSFEAASLDGNPRDQADDCAKDKSKSAVPFFSN